MNRRIDELATALRAARVELEPDEEHLVAHIYRTLSKGASVDVSTLAAGIGTDESWVAERLDRWPGVFRDEGGRLVGFWGLALVEMDHRFVVDGRTLYTWCAWDPLFIAPLIDRTARVSSTCPVTGTEISLSVGPDGVRDLSPAEAVLSFLAPSDDWQEDVITRFCHYVLLFANREAGERWVSEHPGTFLIDVEDGFELGRRARLFGPKEVGA